MPGKKINKGRDGDPGVKEINRINLELAFMESSTSAACVRQEVSNLAPTVLRDFLHNSGAAMTPILGSQSLIDQQRLAKENVDMTINNRRMPTIALKQCFRRIKMPKPFKRCKFSQLFIPRSDGHWKNRKVVDRHSQGEMGKTPVEGAQLLGALDVHHRICAFGKHTNHLIGVQQPGRLAKE